MSVAPISGMTFRPLCRKYLFARFGSLKVQIQTDEDGQSVPVRWALGAHASGALEVLGLWLGLQGDDSPWLQISNDLRLAGVEGVRFVSSTEPSSGRMAFADAGTLAPTEPYCSERLDAAPGHLRGTIWLAESTFQRMNASLVRLAKKVRHFDTRETAVLVLNQKLYNEERRLARQHAMSREVRSLRRRATSSNLSAQI